MLGPRTSQVTNINIEAPSSFVLTSLKQVFKREKVKCARNKEEKLSWGLTTILVDFYTEEVLWNFLPCGFPEENICVLFVVVLVGILLILLL